MHGISQQNTPVLLVGAGLPQLPLVLKNAKPYTERLFDFRTIGGLPRPDGSGGSDRAGRQARSAVRTRCGRTDPRPHGRVPALPAAMGRNGVARGGGSGDHAPGRGSAEELVNDELDRRFFRDRYEKATEAETIYMAAMADLGDGGHSSTDIAAHMRMSQRDLSVRRAGLIEKGLIYSPIGTRLDFTVPQFAAYLRRIHPFDPDQRPSRGRPRRQTAMTTRCFYLRSFLDPVRRRRHEDRARSAVRDGGAQVCILPRSERIRSAAGDHPVREGRRGTDCAAGRTARALAGAQAVAPPSG